MKRQLILTHSPIDEPALLAARGMSHGMGACATFVGVVRQDEAGERIRALDYEGFERMVTRQFDLIFKELEERWPIESLRVVHRLGVVPVNEASLWVEIIAPHRGEAFAACQHLIEEMKRVVPIWKRAVPAPQSQEPR